MVMVVFDGRYIQDRYHGIGRYAFHLVQQLAAGLPDQQFEVLRNPQLPDSRFDWTQLTALANVTVHVLMAAPFGPQEQVLLPRLLATRRRALYHTPYFALPWLLPAAAVITIHDCIFEHDARYMPRRQARGYYRLLMRAAIARARAILVPSQATAADVRRFYGVTDRKIYFTPEAADAGFRPIPDPGMLAAVRGRYRLPEVFVLAVGARRPHKNFARLVRAMAGVETATLVFAGEADPRFPDEAALAAQDLGSRVQFLGKVPECDLPALYNLATVLACPSLIEGFGLPVLEAFGCGTPVVCADIPVFREVTGTAALLVPPLDVAAWGAALQRVVNEPALHTRLRRQGLQRAAQFSWQRTVMSLLGTYRQLACGAGP